MSFFTAATTASALRVHATHHARNVTGAPRKSYYSSTTKQRRVVTNISTTGSTRTIYTGNSPGYPHVGLGFSGQIIVWGYDLNASAYGHWANWYDGNPCCNAGNTSAITTGGWRYVIYIR